MRVLKFRAWDTVTKKYFWSWPAGFYLFGEVTCFDCMGQQLSEQGRNNILGLNDLVIEQFTGLRDKNGLEIYEGDILVADGYSWFDEGAPNYRGVVKWVFSQWQVILWCVNPDKSGISNGINSNLNDDGFLEGERSYWEVIGNIHDNPDLLKMEEEE